MNENASVLHTLALAAGLVKLANTAALHAAEVSRKALLPVRVRYPAL